MLSLDVADLRTAFEKITWGQWAMAAGFTALSFRAVGTYDVLVHRILNTGQPEPQARTAGILAIAIAQTVGFGALSGGLVRWRCMPELGGMAIARLSAIVSVTFLAALAAVSAVVVPLSGVLPVSTGAVAGGLAALLGLVVLGRLAHRIGWIEQRLRFQVIAALLLATAIDTLAAAAALWVLWPDGTPFGMLFGAYLVALGAGLVSNSPGGIGAFDLTLLALLPLTDAAPATCALLAFRIVYYLLPAAIALALLARPKRRAGGPFAAHPEGTLAMQNAHVDTIAKREVLTLPAFGVRPVFGDLPMGLSPHDISTPLYKCSNTQAARARRAGWTVLRCAEDALIDVAKWSLGGPDKRQLRRALNSAEAAGITVSRATDLQALRPVAEVWARRHGGERGLSMGRFDPAYLAHQHVFVARQRGQIIAFISLHAGNDHWTLDLMRHEADCPKGTMHALVTHAITAAKDAGLTELSLAAVPAPAQHLPFARKALRDSAGLRRFKTAFAPVWHPRYIAASGPIRLGYTMLALALRIHHPPALPNTPQHLDEDFSFEPTSRACEGLGTN
ncbi:phosphatidylglycerol lysyltransferase domain-containing protein [Pseudooctadecabacter jejudonensis]|nr:phosphatidylglycerol lysyltransferase domain-containing protein [Pseudooctadecabacter jejudonensis]